MTTLIVCVCAGSLILVITMLIAVLFELRTLHAGLQDAQALAQAERMVLTTTIARLESGVSAARTEARATRQAIVDAEHSLPALPAMASLPELAGHSEHSTEPELPTIPGKRIR